ncbi:TPA: two-component system response regulator RstA, partial [Enterobacter hormaechei]|nr:two-component system response regulator RstA [Enterobacter hormaechei]
MNKIVYVEDEPEVGQLIAAYLGKHDMEVVVEPRGDRAEDVVNRENP